MLPPKERVEINIYSFSLILIMHVPSALSFRFIVEISLSFSLSANTRLTKVAVSIPVFLNWLPIFQPKCIKSIDFNVASTATGIFICLYSFSVVY